LGYGRWATFGLFLIGNTGVSVTAVKQGSYSSKQYSSKYQKIG